jgi:selenoprotein W-related protein
LAATVNETFGITSDLIEGRNGIFDVIADGTLVFSKHETGRFPSHDEVVAALRAQGATSSTA